MNRGRKNRNRRTRIIGRQSAARGDRLKTFMRLQRRLVECGLAVGGWSQD